MTRLMRLMAVVSGAMAAVMLAGCGERPQVIDYKQGKYQGKPDEPPYAAAPFNGNKDQWERDFDNIAAMGLQIVHMAEFAWFELEPKPGEFHFEWLDKCVEMCKQRKLDVMLCTPTAAPPIWLSMNEETLPIDERGTRTLSR